MFSLSVRRETKDYIEKKNLSNIFLMHRVVLIKLLELLAGDLKANRSATSDPPREDNSKSSVVVLYHGRSHTPASSISKVPVRLSKSDQTVAASHLLQPETTSSALPDK